MLRSLVSLTFDDGREKQYTEFYPILDKHGMKATFYIATQRIGWKGVMGWDELKTLYREGNEIGSHTHSHPHLLTLSNGELDYEFKKSHDMLRIFQCGTVAYPYGEYDERVEEHAKKYFKAARGHYNPNIGAKGLRLNLDWSQEKYRLKAFPTEQTVPLEGFNVLQDCSLFKLPFPVFRKTFIELLEYSIERRAWIIFTIHGTYHGRNITWAFKKPKETTEYLVHRLTKLSSISDFTKEKALCKDTTMKFRCMCEILAQNDQLEVSPVSQVIEKYSTLTA